MVRCVVRSTMPGKFFLFLRVRCLRYFFFVRTISGKGTLAASGGDGFFF